jgi:hypothetical protein
MSKRSITLVGRASRLQCHDDHVSFLLTVKAKAQQGEFVVECRAHRKCDIEAFESMDEGSLAGIIGTISLIPRNPHVIVRLDRLEILGKPLQEVA